GGATEKTVKPTTVPSRLRANPFSPSPAAIATTLLNPGGMVIKEGKPKDETVPSFLRTKVAYTPAATATILLAAGTFSSPFALSPQETTRPSLLSATLKTSPSEIARTLLRPGGTLVSPLSLEPHAVTVPSRFRARVFWYPASMAFTLVRSEGTRVSG